MCLGGLQRLLQAAEFALVSAMTICSLVLNWW